LNIDFSALTKSLRAFAASLYFAEGISDPEGILPGTGKSAKDLVHEALMIFIKGKSGWKPKTGQNGASAVLKRVIKNDFIDLLKSSGHKSTDIVDTYSNGSVSETQPAAKTLDGLGDPSLSLDDLYCPDAVVEARRVYPAIKGDADLVAYVEAVLIFGANTRAQIAQDLGVPLEEVDNRRRRLRTALAWYERNAQAKLRG
jgi:DNA-directed RNA polymerase specialized sigma24 family protein